MEAVMGGLWVRLAVTTVVLGLAASAGRCADASDAPAEVDAAVVLAADVSRSIDDGEFALERRGYAEAIQSRKLLDAISTGPHGAIALCYVEWAGEGEQMIVADWAVIRNAADARAFAAALSGAPRSFVGRTAIGSAINFASGLFSEAKFATDSRVIDVSGDGTSNQGSPVAAARRGGWRWRDHQWAHYFQPPGRGDGRLSGAAHQSAGRTRAILPRQRHRRDGRVRRADRRFQQFWRRNGAQARQRDRGSVTRGDLAFRPIRAGRDGSRGRVDRRS